MIAFNHVSKYYGQDRIALHTVNLTIEQASIVSVIGPSGAGKTTLLRCINRLIECTAGSIELNGEPVTGANRRRLKQLRRKVGMIFQNYNLVERLTVLENTLHGCLGAMPWYRSILGLYSAKEKERALAVLTDIGMENHAYQRCADLSGGQKQRTGIARALMQEPDILLCDEPVSSLDPQSAQDILNYLENIVRRKGMTCIMNLHHVEYAKRYSDRIIGLREGQIVFDGAPAELSNEMLSHIFSSDTAHKMPHKGATSV